MIFSLGVEALMESATGWPGLLIVVSYGFLVAVLFPSPLALVLVTPLNLGIPNFLEISIIIILASFGEAIGSFFAFKVGHTAKNSNKILNLLRRLPINVIGWSEKKSVEIAKRWGFVGLAFLLSIPFFPDTISIYTFSLLEENYFKFFLATFSGSTVRLIIYLLFARGTLAIIT